MSYASESSNLKITDKFVEKWLPRNHTKLYFVFYYTGSRNTSLGFQKSQEFDDFELTNHIRDALVACSSIGQIDMSGFSVRSQWFN